MEADSLQRYARNPGTAGAPKEAVYMLTDWKSARKRMMSVGIGDVSSMEQQRALKQMVSSVIPKNEAVLHRLNLRLHMRENESPTMSDAEDLYEF